MRHPHPCKYDSLLYGIDPATDYCTCPKREMNKISVEERGHDFMAYLNDDRRMWSCGKTPNEAIGNLVRTWSDTLKIKICN